MRLASHHTERKNISQCGDPCLFTREAFFEKTESWLRMTI